MSTPNVPVGTIVDAPASSTFLYSSEDITITIGGQPVVYFSKSIRLSAPMKRIVGENSASVAVRKSYVPQGFYSGSADLMYPSTGTPTVPPPGAQGTMTIPELGASPIAFTVTNPQPSRSNDAEATCSIDFDTNIGTVTVGS